MKIGIDISQIAFENTGVANYMKNLTLSMLRNDHKNTYVFFFSSLRQTLSKSYEKEVKRLGVGRVQIRTFRFPPSFLSTLWNTIHKLPIETFVGDVDVFISSDWYQPPSKKAKLATILYDLIVYKFPKETHAQTSFSFKNLQLKQNIVQVQKRRIKWVKKECDLVFCISQSTKEDAKEILGIDEKKLIVTYPGI